MSDDGFAVFWSEYPRHAAKPVAMRAWLRLAPSAELQTTILAAVAQWRRTEQWQTPKLIPHPATFLNQRRWEDDIPDDVMTTRTPWRPPERQGPWCRHDPKCGSRAWHDLLIARGELEPPA